ncbi:MAG: RNA polymerase sigma factor [Candidatus Eisenbacteria bacterium]|nr:RNA polymerase sigma factor [Candidatus Eisenbacteria bacterium]
MTPRKAATRPTTDQREETLLVLRAQVGDRLALDRLFQRIQGPLHGYLQRLGGPTVPVDDLLQETLLQIYRKLDSLRAPELFRPWCYRLATRLAWRYLRRERRWSDRIESLDAPGEATSVVHSSGAATQPVELALGRMDDLLEKASAASRPVLILHYMNELSIVEVAEALSLPIGTVKSRLAYGLAAMRRALGESNGE